MWYACMGRSGADGTLLPIPDIDCSDAILHMILPAPHIGQWYWRIVVESPDDDPSESAMELLRKRESFFIVPPQPAG